MFSAIATAFFFAGCTAYTPGASVDERLNHNQIYVEDADFDEVYDFIAARCVNAKGRGLRKTRKV